MVFVTGGTGLVGAHLLLKLLEDGRSVRAAKRKESDISQTLKTFSMYNEGATDLFNKIEWVDVDLCDVHEVEEALKGIREVYHCAALVSYLPQDAQMMLKWNTTATANLINISLELKMEKFCMVSSVAALGSEKNIPVIDENQMWKNDPNNSTYAISKYLSEMEVWRGREEGLNVCIVNPSIILGPGKWGKSSTMIFDSVYKGMPFYTNGTGGFVDVRDVVHAMIGLMDNNIFGERFILNAESVKFKDVFSQIAVQLGKRPPFIESKKWMSQLLWRIEWLRNRVFRVKPIVTKETAYSAHNSKVYSTEKIKKALGMKFIPVSESIATHSGFFLKDH